MAVTLPPSLSRIPTSSPTPAAQGVQGTNAATTPAAPLPEKAAALSTLVDAFEQVSALQQQWASKYAANGPAETATAPEVPDLAEAGLSDVNLPDVNLAAATDVLPGQVDDFVDEAALPAAGAETLATQTPATQTASTDPATAKAVDPEGDGVIKQTNDKDCGATTAAMLSETTGKPSTGSSEETIKELDQRFATADGTTPRQLTDMLAHEGMTVTKGSSIVDPYTLNEALDQGKKVVAMVDSNKILPPGQTAGEGTGQAHWVILDGKDAQGNFSVKDPGTGTKYSVSLDKLTDAVNSGWGAHNSGGMMVVEKAQEGANEGTVAEANAQLGLMLGNNPGGGSNAKNSYGREST
ncbi:C39 family peptidase [Hyalangium versicolor]|uniref:C39 family peptidase n=1 Tax=Hyalangium versicolor TaxID=2861190 RepID=UPI001CCC2C0C|nr:C39 family peptidase [Hyalangium versicolor]